MIGRVHGTILEASPLLVLLDVGGVGYEVHVPITTAEKLPPNGGTCSLFTHAVYREDSASLYGFATREDRDFFRLLVERVSGIGPKIGISILSRMSAELLREAIARSDVNLLAQCPGIGKKTAERLIIELKDKVFPEGTTPAAPTGAPGDSGAVPSHSAPGASAYSDAVASLITLGYKPADADKLVRKAASKLESDASVETLVRAALS